MTGRTGNLCTYETLRKEYLIVYTEDGGERDLRPTLYIDKEILVYLSVDLNRWKTYENVGGWKVLLKIPGIHETFK